MRSRDGNFDLPKLVEDMEPSSDLFDRIVRTGTRQRKAARLRAGAVGIAAATLAISLLVPWLRSGPADDSRGGPLGGTTLPTITVPAATPPDCPSLASGENLIIEPAEAPPGSIVNLAVAIPLFDENDEYVAPTGEVQVWWNADPENWPDVLQGGNDPTPVSAGSVQLLVSMDATGKCYAEGSFIVPSVPSGDYYLVMVLVGNGGASPVFPEDKAATPTFRVTKVGLSASSS